MTLVELVMPKMGESIMEATILKWVKQVGDKVEVDETILEIATDKVDSEVPSPTAGVLQEIRFQENDTVEVGKIIAIIATEADEAIPLPSPSVEKPVAATSASNGKGQPAAVAEAVVTMPADAGVIEKTGTSQRFYSPLVRNIAKEEQITMAELEQLEGSGLHGRVTKKDILAYVENRSTAIAPQPKPAPSATLSAPPKPLVSAASVSGEVEIIEMDRMRRLIADHMVMSKQTSAHVTSFVEIDVTNIVQWREQVKKTFEQKFGEKITFTPIFIEAIVKAIHDFPMINISVEGTNIIRKKYIN
ncbi:MAG TPA: 2-oxo acid dehydrogenase subunit E2, partial [Saprospiraceae bacterium]|nr:2-oxo acid dehydrogenase subunit E2 [Saprospiraceae bacterium]